MFRQEERTNIKVYELFLHIIQTSWNYNCEVNTPTTGHISTLLTDQRYPETWGPSWILTSWEEEIIIERRRSDSIFIICAVQMFYITTKNGLLCPLYTGLGDFLEHVLANLALNPFWIEQRKPTTYLSILYLRTLRLFNYELYFKYSFPPLFFLVWFQSIF